ncbi:MAG: WG repeat-containing protein [Saprospiraceae bacterium]|nr:WG repeat-containing protein [Saprospiraceae bacterium]
MHFRILFLLSFFSALYCGAQNPSSTEEIFYTSNYKWGVKSKSGKLVIDTIYDRIFVLYENNRLTLPPKDRNQPGPWLNCYIVISREKGTAIFSSSGKILFDFVQCNGLQYDARTQTVVVIKQLADNRLRSTLHSMDGRNLFEDDFESIGYVTRSDLIVLIAEDGAKDEFYIYNAKENLRTGPYSHINVFNQDSSPLLGMKEEEFNKFRNLNILTVRKTVDNEDIWGIMNLEGELRVPFSYKRFRIIDSSMQSTLIDKCQKPDNVEFVFYSYDMNDTNETSLLLFDARLDLYKYDAAERKIFKAD